MEKDKLTTNEYWDTGYKNLIFSPMPKKYPIVKKIYKHFPITSFSTILEIGCFPGRFLYHFGKLGYELNGIDQTKYLKDMVDWFKINKFKIGIFEKEDIYKIEKNKKYDIVFSSGFIEHFTNFEEIIKIHINLVNKNGYIFITTPNFSGLIQNKLHKWLDNDNLEKHCVPSMNPESWKRILVEENFDIIDYGYIGGFDFWVGDQKRNHFKKIIIKILRLISKFNIYPNNKMYSPEIFIIAKKK